MKKSSKGKRAPKRKILRNFRKNPKNQKSKNKNKGKNYLNPLIFKKKRLTQFYLSIYRTLKRNRQMF